MVHKYFNTKKKREFSNDLKIADIFTAHNVSICLFRSILLIFSDIIVYFLISRCLNMTFSQLITDRIIISNQSICKNALNQLASCLYLADRCAKYISPICQPTKIQSFSSPYTSIFLNCSTNIIMFLQNLRYLSENHGLWFALLHSLQKLFPEFYPFPESFYHILKAPYELRHNKHLVEDDLCTD